MERKAFIPSIRPTSVSLSLLAQLGQLRNEARDLEGELETTKQNLRTVVERKNELLDQMKKLNSTISESRKRRD